MTTLTHPHHCGCGACGADGEVAPRPDGGGPPDRVARLLAVLVCVLAMGVCVGVLIGGGPR